MQLMRAFARQAGAITLLLSSTALVQAADVSFLTHWSPETVARLETAAAAYTAQHPDTKITVRAVPFGDLLTTLRTSGGGADGGEALLNAEFQHPVQRAAQTAPVEELTAQQRGQQAAV